MSFPYEFGEMLRTAERASRSIQGRPRAEWAPIIWHLIESLDRAHIAEAANVGLDLEWLRDKLEERMSRGRALLGKTKK